MGRGSRMQACAVTLRHPSSGAVGVPAWHPGHGNARAAGAAAPLLEHVDALEGQITLARAETFELAEATFHDLVDVAAQIRDADPGTARALRRATDELTDALQAAFSSGLAGSRTCPAGDEHLQDAVGALRALFPPRT